MLFRSGPDTGTYYDNNPIGQPTVALYYTTTGSMEFDSVDVASDLDLAGLIDCGWEISPPLELTATSLKPSATAFTWKSSSFLDYKVERGSNLQTFPSGSTNVAGDGTIQAWTDPAAPASNTFYRLRATKASGSAAPAPAPAATRSINNFRTVAFPPKFATGCYEGGE